MKLFLTRRIFRSNNNQNTVNRNKKSGISKPWDIMVDSSATTAFPRDKASETSGDTLTSPTPTFSFPPYKETYFIFPQANWT